MKLANAKKGKKLSPKSVSTQPPITLSDGEFTFNLRKDGTALAILLTLAAGYFLPVLLHGNERVLSSIDGDTWSYFFYARRFAFARMAGGELPLWNPYNFSGTPLVGTMQSAIFYPPNLLFLLFDTPFAINLSIALHCLFASVFTYSFARYISISPHGSVLSAVTFVYSAPYFIHIYAGHLPHLSAMWMPLLFLCVEAFMRHKRTQYAIWAGVVLALQLLAGYPQYSFYTALAVSLYVFIHLLLQKATKDLVFMLRGYVIFVVVAATLAAVQLVPAWEMVTNSARGSVSFAWISIFSLPPENLLTLLLPHIFGDMVNVPYWGKNNLWEMSVYLGLVPFVMMAMSLILNWNRQVMVFTIIGGGFLLLALGKHTPFLWFLYSFVPGFGLFRGVGKAAFVFAFAAAIIAGFGLDKVRLMIEQADKRLCRLGLILIASAALFGVIAVLTPAVDIKSWGSLVQAYLTTEEHFSSLPLNESFFSAAQRMFWLDIAKLLLFTIALGALCLGGYKSKKRSGNVIAVSILVLAVADLWHFGSRFLVSFDPAILSMDAESKAFLQRDTEPFRIATPLAPLRNHLLNAGSVEGIENVGGYDAIVIKQYSELINLTQGLPIDQPNLLMGINRVSPLLNLLNVKYYLVDPSIELKLPGFELVFQNSRDKIYRSLNALPRSFIVHAARVARGQEDTFRELSDPGFQPLSMAVVDQPVDGLNHNSQVRSPIPQIVEKALQRIVIDADAAAPGLLILGDSYYPGWKAFIDGRGTKIYRANHVMRAVRLPAGRHRIEFRYDPLAIKLGAAISGLGVLMLAALLIGKSIASRFQAPSS